MYKIIIADDEAIECRALEMMIRNNFSEVEILPSVHNGTDLIASVENYQPDIAIVDINMPRLNGLDALEMLRSRKHQMKIIISSAYSDFKYVKKAMTLGVFDYILKPLEKETFLETLDKVLHTLNEERKKEIKDVHTEKHIDEMTSVVGNEFLSSLMLGEPDEKSFHIYLESLQHQYHGGFLVAVRRLYGERELSRESSKELLEAMKEELGKFCSSVGKLHKEELYFLILPGDYVGEQNVKKWLNDIMEMLCLTGKRKGQNGLVFGISTWKYDYEEMGAGLTECKIAARSQGKPGIYYYENPEKKERVNIFDGLGEKCLFWMKQGDLDSCLEEIEALFEKIEIPQEELLNYQMQVMAFVLPICEYMESGQDYCSRYEKKRGIHYSELTTCGNKEELKAWLTECLRNLSEKGEAKEKKSREYIERTIIYMEKHYMENISLEQTAEASGISSFYLSRLLKQELSQTFVEILTDIRMKKALSLMWNGNYTVKEISEKVGYSNITYFYKVFKKYTGMNIGEMREYLN